MAVAGVLLLTGDGDTPSPPRAAPTPAPTPVLDAPSPGPSLALGITEPNPSLVAVPGARGVPPEWVRWRDELARIRPAVYRLVVVWSQVQPRADAPADLAKLDLGCMRAVQPCAPYAGLRDQLRALASRQREEPGWQALVVITGTPDWAAVPANGCRRGAQFGAVRATALPAYRKLIADVLTVAGQERADLRFFSPWNEPNHAYFLSPQRARCDAGAPSRAVPSYAALAAAMRAELAVQPGDQRLVLGETAGLLEPSPRATSVREMIRGLPRELVCSAPVWSQHAYIGGTDPVSTVTAALATRRCPRPPAIWITETGVGPAPQGFSLARGITSERHGCRLLHQRLLQWHENPRVTLAVQYTFREDDLFPTGLVTTDLTRSRAALGEWQAWGARPSPVAPPPAASCDSSNGG